MFDQVSLLCSKKVTQTYSTSFSLGIKYIHASMRPAIYAIYGFVRLADEVVDSFHSYNKDAMIVDLERQTYQAIEERISLNPILNSFQWAVHEYAIQPALIDAFLHSMKMDLNPCAYTKNEYEKYIYGSAEVVGLMCLHVFCNRNMDLFEELKPAAKKLGSALQKVNFLRDFKSDSEELGRVYFPNVNFLHFNEADKATIVNDIKEEFREAAIGIKKLPIEAKRGVYLAFVYYKALLAKIEKTPAMNIKTQRIRIPNYNKFALLCRCYIWDLPKG